MTITEKTGVSIGVLLSISGAAASYAKAQASIDHIAERIEKLERIQSVVIETGNDVKWIKEELKELRRTPRR